MSYCKRNDPGQVNTWRRRVSEGVKRSHRRCPACLRASNGGTHRYPEERLTVWLCRYCGHQISRAWIE